MAGLVDIGDVSMSIESNWLLVEKGTIDEARAVSGTAVEGLPEC
jgi:hypothetical protein